MNISWFRIYLYNIYILFFSLDTHIHIHSFMLLWKYDIYISLRDFSKMHRYISNSSVQQLLKGMNGICSPIICVSLFFFFVAHIATQITRHRPWLNQQFVTADYPAVRVEKRRVTRNSLWCRNNEPQYRLPDYKRTEIIELQMIPPVPLALRSIFCFFVILRYDFSRWLAFNQSYDSINTNLILIRSSFYLLLCL